MKRFVYFLGIATLFFIFSCSGLKRERGVQDDNIFYSSSPKLKIKINPDFKYKGADEKSDSVLGFDPSEPMIDFDQDTYLFENVTDNRAIVIQFVQIRFEHGYFGPIEFSHLENLYDSGTATLNRNNYKYAVFILKPSNDECFLVKLMVRDANEQNRIQIYYVGGFPWCASWNEKDMLTDEQKHQLETFINNSFEDIQDVSIK